jgi:hypothetical protein
LADSIIFPSFEPLSLKHQNLIEDILRRYPPEISELTFTNLFCWREYYRFQISLYEDFLTLLAHPPGHSPFFFPPAGKGDLRAWTVDCLTFLKDRGHVPIIARLPNSMVQTILSLPNLKALLDRDNSDYVYLIKNLIRLSGNRYHTPKNHLNQFKKNYPAWEYLSLTPDLVRDCLDLQEKWCRWRQCEDDPHLVNEEQAILEAFRHLDVLNYKGGVILLEGRVEAFTLGELLTPETVVIHFEKANPERAGLYQLIQQQFLENEWSSIPYVNREQDLGIEGLRKAKLSYNPEFMVDKYKVFLNEDRI